MLRLSNFALRRPRHEIAQKAALDWLVDAHVASRTGAEGLSASERDAFATQLGKLMQRCGCQPDRIRARGHSVSDLGRRDWQNLRLYDVERHPRGVGTAVRSELYAEVVNAYFEQEFPVTSDPPSELVHVTCTGYVAPSGAQRVVARNGWGAHTRVSHAYHMGCYAAFPAIRLAAGHLSSPVALLPRGQDLRVDIVHTELCTLHLDPNDHSPEQLVIQSLFGDGFIRYSLSNGEGPGLEVLALDERILPDSADAMTWTASDCGLHMTLARDVPARLAAELRGFVGALFERAGLNLAQDLRHSVAAIHPGGPRIIDGVREVLELSEEQVETSRGVLLDYGNMSSATLPHVWQRLVDDERVAPGTLILSLAFGPGLTLCGGLFRKCRAC